MYKINKIGKMYKTIKCLTKLAGQLREELSSLAAVQSTYRGHNYVVSKQVHCILNTTLQSCS